MSFESNGLNRIEGSLQWRSDSRRIAFVKHAHYGDKKQFSGGVTKATSNQQ
jgi:hypothetical protein